MGVYLLHFEGPNKKKAHYLGCTTRDPEKRLKEHAGGHGSVYTSKLIKQGFVPRIAWWQPDWGFSYERKLKLLSRANKDYQFKKWCPCCAGRLYYPPNELEVQQHKYYSKIPRGSAHSSRSRP